MNMKTTALITVCIALLAGAVFSAPIHDVSGKGDLAKVKALLKKAPKLINLADKDGATPLHYATSGNHKSVVELLLSKNANVNAKKKNGVTPLHIAAALGLQEIVKVLLSKGANPNAADSEDRTPLSLAEANGHTAVVELLNAESAKPTSAIAVFTPQSSSGIELLVTGGDGQWETRTIEDRKTVSQKQGITPPAYYLYFKLAPKVRAKIGSDAYLVVDFLDQGLGQVGTQYNSTKEQYARGEGFILLGTGKWQRSLIRLTGVRFRGLQNAGADFRLDGAAVISRLEVYNDNPGLDLPSASERVKEAFKNMVQPDGMFYTFGNDATGTSGPFYKALGVTSIESYVTWETCESKGEGQWDWSHWDKQVKILKDYDLKWVPFLIIGPAYSTPNWFRASSEHVPCRCLEHGTDSKIESLWNPYLPARIDRFLGEFAKRYKDSGVLESLLLGIQGDFGEAIYSVWGGGWTFDIPGEYHNHAGFWCGDPYALADFRKFVSEKYKTVETINKAWGTDFASLEDVDFPGRKEGLKTFQDRLPSGDPEDQRRWLDFVDWYRDSMTQWSDWWIATTRKHFPETPIYLCTGGDAPPEHGSDFAEQCRVAAKYKAGVRITNEASDYAQNFYLTHWVASAGKHYGAYFGFEPAGAEDEKGIVVRIYNATVSGANQLHDYSNNPTGSEERISQQRKHIKYLFHVPKPVVPVALWYPNVSMTLKWGEYDGKVMALRDYLDFDFVDETMLRTNALQSYKILLIEHGKVMETADARRIAEWMEGGGLVIVSGVPRFESVEGTDEPARILFGDSPQGRTLGKGGIVRLGMQEELIPRLEKVMRSLGLAVYDLKKDGVFGSQIAEDRFLFLNTGTADVPVTIECKGKKVASTASAGTITEVRL